MYFIISMITGYNCPQVNDAELSLLKQHFKEGLKPTRQYPITHTFVFLQRYTKKQALKVTSEQGPENVSSARIFEIKESYLFFTEESYLSSRSLGKILKINSFSSQEHLKGNQNLLIMLTWFNTAKDHSHEFESLRSGNSTFNKTSR